MKINMVLEFHKMPRLLAGIIPFVIAVWIASIQDVSLWWSIPAGLWFGETIGFTYETIVKIKKGES